LRERTQEIVREGSHTTRRMPRTGRAEAQGRRQRV